MVYEVVKPEPTPGDTSWFTHDRFGLFIHGVVCFTCKT